MAENSISMLGLLNEMTKQAEIYVDPVTADLSHADPRWMSFLRPSNVLKFRWVSHYLVCSSTGSSIFLSTTVEAHNSNARRTLATVLSPAEIATLESPAMLKDVLPVAEEIRDRYANTPGSARVRTVVQTMGKYMGVFDVLAQSNVTFTWIWSFLRYILIFAAKYVHLWQRVADMIEDIGHSLPRIMLYQHLLPNEQISQRIAELYGAIMDFLVKTICFLSKRRFRRFRTMFWGPFEADYETCMNRVCKLSAITDKEAETSAMVLQMATMNQLATAIAQQRAAISSISQQVSELKLVSGLSGKPTLRFEGGNAATLLQSDRNGGLNQPSIRLEINFDRLRVYTSYVTPEYDRRIQAEKTSRSWNNQDLSMISCIRPDYIRQAIVMGSSATMTEAQNASPSVHFQWAPNMTEADAMFTLTSQYISRFSDKLSQSEARDLYEQVRQAKGNACLLFELYKQIISRLPSSRSVLIITSDSEHAANFIRKLTVHNEQQHSHCHSLLIYHLVKDPDLTSAPGFLDGAYNLERDVNVCEGLSRIALLALGRNPERLTETGRTPWSQLWVALHYSFMIYAHPALATALFSKLGGSTAPRKAVVQEIIRKFMGCLDVNIPDEIQDCLQRLIATEQASARAAIQLAPQDNNYSLSLDTIPWQPEPLTSQHRFEVWTKVEAIVMSFTQRTFQSVVELQLKVADPSLNGTDDLLHQVGYVLSPKNWDHGILKSVRDGVVSCLCQATEVGMRHVIRLYLHSKFEHESRMAMGQTVYTSGDSQAKQHSNRGEADWLLRL